MLDPKLIDLKKVNKQEGKIEMKTFQKDINLKLAMVDMNSEQMLLESN